MPTIEEDAREYVDTLNGPANGWGQHVCKRTGFVSHWMLIVGNGVHGKIKFQEAIDTIFKELRHDIHRHRCSEDTG